MTNARKPKEDELDRHLADLLRQLIHGGRLLWGFTGRVSLDPEMVGFAAGMLAAVAFDESQELVTPKRALRVVRREFERRRAARRAPRSAPAVQPQPLPPEPQQEEPHSQVHESFFRFRAAPPVGGTGSAPRR